MRSRAILGCSARFLIVMRTVHCKGPGEDNKPSSPSVPDMVITSNQRSACSVFSTTCAQGRTAFYAFLTLVRRHWRDLANTTRREMITLAVPLSTQEYKWVPANCQGNLIPSHPGGVAILLVATCYENWDKLWQ